MAKRVRRVVAAHAESVTLCVHLGRVPAGPCMRCAVASFSPALLTGGHLLPGLPPDPRQICPDCYHGVPGNRRSSGPAQCALKRL